MSSVPIFDLGDAWSAWGGILNQASRRAETRGDEAEVS